MQEVVVPNEARISKIQQDLDKIHEYLRKDIRLTRHTNSAVNGTNNCDDLENLESKKIYQEWKEQQTKQKEAEVSDMQISEKVALLAEIQGIHALMKKQNTLSGSFYDVVQTKK